MIILRDYQLDDAETLASLANNRNVSRYLTTSFPYPYTLEDAKWWIEEGSSQNRSVSRAIELDSSLVGGIGLNRHEGWKSHIAEIGYWVAEPYWGRGIATEAVKQMTELALGELSFRKLVAPVLAPNLGSARVLEKCGYQLEATLKTEVCKSGEYFDILQYALLGDQYEN